MLCKLSDDIRLGEMELPVRIPVIVNFDIDKLIGYAKVFRDEATGDLMAEINLGVDISTLKFEDVLESEILVTPKFELRLISLSPTPKNLFEGLKQVNDNS